MRKTKSVKELRRICQDPKFDYSAYLKQLRRVSIYLTRLFLMLGVPANSVTVVSIVFVMASFIPFLWVSHWYFIVLSAVLLNIAYLLDCVDGELARYHGSTYYGRLLDVVGHDLFYLVFLFIGFGVYSMTNMVIFLVLGASASLFKLLLRLHEMRFEYMNVTGQLKKKPGKGGRISNAFYKIGLAELFLPVLYIVALLASFQIIFVQAFLLFYAVYMPLYWIAWLARKRGWKEREKKGESETEFWKRLRKEA